MPPSCPIVMTSIMSGHSRRHAPSALLGMTGLLVTACVATGVRPIVPPAATQQPPVFAATVDRSREEDDLMFAPLVEAAIDWLGVPSVEPVRHVAGKP
jgi:hypothetical protein